jgi:hypothetical protein
MRNTNEISMLMKQAITDCATPGNKLCLRRYKK